MELILIRHAKAEDRVAGLVDLDRHLTDKGKKNYHRLLPELKEKLANPKKAHLFSWSSPALRAVETAELAIGELSIEEPSIHEYIYTGDLEVFLEELATVPDDATLLIFGHEPTLSTWIEIFTGEMLRMKKGSMVSMDVLERSPLKAKLNWQIRP